MEQKSGLLKKDIGALSFGGESIWSTSDSMISTDLGKSLVLLVVTSLTAGVVEEAVRQSLILQSLSSSPSSSTSSTTIGISLLFFEYT